MKLDFLLFDFWNTLAYSKERDVYWFYILKSLERKKIVKREFFNFWKESWFKSNIDKEIFVKNLGFSFDFSIEEKKYFMELLNPGNIELFSKRVELLFKLKSMGYNMVLVSDSGSDISEFVDSSVLSGVFLKKFYSFKYGTTKEEDLYSYVVNYSGKNALMIGDDYKRDFLIPRRYGINSLYIKPKDDMGEKLCRILSIF